MDSNDLEGPATASLPSYDQAKALVGICPAVTAPQVLQLSTIWRSAIRAAGCHIEPVVAFQAIECDLGDDAVLYCGIISVVDRSFLPGPRQGSCRVWRVWIVP